MKIHYEMVEDIRRYISNNKDISLEEKEPQFRNILRAVRRFKGVDAETRMIEIGTGTGWFPLLCQLNGLKCKGLEISPQLIECSREIGAKYDLIPDIELGNLEETDLGRDQYDVVICSNVFEHVEYWRQGVAKVYAALKPGGLMYFESTNKFSFTSGEYSGPPTFGMYGWLPDQFRYSLRKKIHGDDIMKLGIDFHQFRHSLMRREFERIGFTTVLDRVQVADDTTVSTGFRRSVVKWARKVPAMKALALTFAEATRFICLK